MGKAPAEVFGAIWDMDGTLVDSAELHFQAWVDICRENGRPFTRPDFAATFGKRNPEILHYLFGNRFSDSELLRLADYKEELYRAAARRTGIQVLPGVPALLESLQQHGFRQAIGSSAPRANLDMILEVTGLEGYFSAIASSEDTQRGKPDPQVFQVAAERLELPPVRCVVFEDAVAGVQAARAAAMPCVAVRFVGHHSGESLRIAGASCIVESLEQISAREVLQLFSNQSSGG